MSMSVTASVNHLLDGEMRLDATYYASAVYQAKKYIQDFKKKGFKILTVKDFSVKTFNPPPIKRIFTDDIVKGSPYMIPQEMFDFYWSPRKFVLAEKMDNIDDWYLHDGWIVLTQSGTVGKPYFSTKYDEKYVLSQNAIRIAPKDPDTSGYVYAYLSTWIGQTLLKKDEFGITVKHIRPHHVESIPIPEIDKKKQREISAKIKKAFILRAQAIELINEAKREVCAELGMPVNLKLEDEEEEE